MSLLDRVALLFKADAHGIVDSLEERSLLLRQYLREAELLLNGHRAKLEALREETERLRTLLAQESETVDRLDQDVALALGGNKEELARFAIRQLLLHRREIERLAALLAERTSEAEALAERVTGEEEKYEDLKTRVRSEPRQTDEPSARPFAAVGSVAEEEVELELMRRRSAGVPS